MPVKIIATGTTSRATGEITADDLQTLKSDFNTKVSLTTLPDRGTVIKKVGFIFSKEQLIELFESVPETVNLVRINIGVQLPGTTDICGNDESNSLAAVIEMVASTPNSPVKVPVGDLVLINGYHDFGKAFPMGEPPCCPSSEPPPSGGNII